MSEIIGRRSQFWLETCDEPHVFLTLLDVNRDLIKDHARRQRQFVHIKDHGPGITYGEITLEIALTLIDGHIATENTRKIAVLVFLKDVFSVKHLRQTRIHWRHTLVGLTPNAPGYFSILVFTEQITVETVFVA